LAADFLSWGSVLAEDFSAGFSASFAAGGSTAFSTGFTTGLGGASTAGFSAGAAATGEGMTGIGWTAGAAEPAGGEEGAKPPSSCLGMSMAMSWFAGFGLLSSTIGRSAEITSTRAMAPTSRRRAFPRS
jgi:hypothetical protein